MKNTVIIILTLTLFSCGVDHTDFSGDWIEKKEEKDRILINKMLIIILLKIKTENFQLN